MGYIISFIIELFAQTFFPVSNPSLFLFQEKLSNLFIVNPLTDLLSDQIQCDILLQVFLEQFVQTFVASVFSETVAENMVVK